VICLVLPVNGQAQPVMETFDSPSGKKAFALSLVLPGLGHRYVNHGTWNTKGTLFALVDATAWVSLFGARWQYGHFTQSYENMAMAHAGAQIDGQSRAFLLNVGQYDNSEEYLDVLLRARAWDRLDDATQPDQQWDWDTEGNRIRYRELRSDAEKMERRTTWVAAILVGNRFLSAISALRAANKPRQGPVAQVSISPADPYGGLQAHLLLRW